ncbi:MAG: hypothetical protein N2439_15265, partial [Anaerolineae bacterium]|nr:hypothetical protein [Anaerolineae bacterium]
LWQGHVAHAAIEPCPALKAVREEMYYTDRLLLATTRAYARVGGTGKIADNLAAFRDGYSRLLDTPPTSLDAYTAQAQWLRFRGNKVYAQLTQRFDAARRERVLLVGALITLVVLGSLAWGLRNTLRFQRTVGWWRSWQPGWRTALAVGLVFVFFSLPLFRTPSAAVETASAEEQAVQTTLDTSGRVADTAERAMARAWMLARVGARWAQMDRAKGEEALAAALTAAAQAQDAADALWGQAQAAREAAVGSTPLAQEKAGLVAEQLNAVRGRAWAMRLIAAEWRDVDADRARQILAQAQTIAEGRAGVYRDLDLRAIAATWAGLDAGRAVQVAGRVQDPALRAWAYRDVARITDNASLYGQAAAAARQIADPVRRSRALAAIGVASGDRALFAEAEQALAQVEGTDLAYALSDLAAAGQNAGLVDRIPAAYGDARALAWLRVGDYRAAWDAAATIADPLRRAHVQAAVAGAWQNADAARAIAEPTYRDRALRTIAVARREAALVREIASAQERVLAWSALEDLDAAVADAAQVRDGYPLRVLGIALAARERHAALQIVERLAAEADKAAILTALAGRAGDPALFERALGMALAARVSGDPLAPAEASLALARQVKDAGQVKRALEQALSATQQINVKYK